MRGLIVDMDAKTALNQFCQRYCSRPVTKVDIMYTTTKFAPSQFQAIVKLNCLEGQEYAGELSVNPKEAEKSAAQQALQAYAAAIASLPPVTGTVSSSRKKKSNPQVGPGGMSGADAGRGMQQMPAGMGAGMQMPGLPGAAQLLGAAQGGQVPVGSLQGDGPMEAQNPALTDKVKLNAACMKIAKRALQKGETLYDTCQVGGGKAPSGFQSTVQLSCLPEAWASRVFAGQVCTNKQGAEQSAATVALACIMEDEELAAVINQATDGSKLSRTKSRGQGGAKGKGGWTYVNGPDLERERLSQAPVTGEVLEWKGHFGWIRLHQPVEHEAAEQRDGKVYVNKKDLVEVEELKQGDTVIFHLYVDASGMGAEDVMCPSSTTAV